MQYWFAVHTKRHKERQVEAFLIERGIEVYLPTVPSARRGSHLIERPFFPNYVFARTDLDITGVWSLHYVPGARGVVMVGDVPARVDDRVIAFIRERLKSDVVRVHGEILKPGDRVVITEGPFADLEAIFDRRLSGAGRVRVLIYVLQRWARVETDLATLRRTSGSPSAIR